MAPMLAGMKTNKAAMRKAAAEGFINATDLADYLVAQKGIPFRAAYKTVGQIVAHCAAEGITLEALPLEGYQAFEAAFDEGLYQAIDLQACVEKRISAGGTGPDSVRGQIAAARAWLNA